jgi:hypothetical protein
MIRIKPVHQLILHERKTLPDDCDVLQKNTFSLNYRKLAFGSVKQLFCSTRQRYHQPKPVSYFLKKTEEVTYSMNKEIVLT